MVNVNIGQFGEPLLGETVAIPQFANAGAEFSKKFLIRHLAAGAIRH